MVTRRFCTVQNGLIAAIVMACVWGVSLPAETDALHRVTLQLPWHHQFQFAGYYAAQKLGYYRDVGLDVDIRPGKVGDASMDRVIRSNSEFGVGSAEIVAARLEGAPLVVVAPIFQHSALAIVSIDGSGIKSIRDVENHKIMIEAQAAELFAYLSRAGVDPEKVEILPHTHSLNPLLNGQASALSAYISDEPFGLLERGIAYTVHLPREVGIDFYGDTLFTQEAFLLREPQIVEAMRDASLRGWEYALAHPEEIVDLILTDYSRDQSRSHLLFEARETRDLIQPDRIPLGTSDPARWRHMAEVFREAGFIVDGPIDLTGLSMDDPVYHGITAWFQGIDPRVLRLVLVAGAFVVFAVVLHRARRRRGSGAS
ncbi:ABC transporter substrate-binding protein [Rhodospirillaceae bacterium KN72]|uniref:Thiamine pyrimidine synthase n=1 Tax=Pacificispira spongiicola TaxID=2729598 RepID=A0A7Y0HCW5_9PROT|nr:ABC transporter substrate-binding protein [Pacificispira spongiicola]NMM43146.1 ABC transporter substrate-binding protein [Pacificispira spongiicola]